MQSLKILIAAAVVLFVSNVLTGCSPQGVSEVGVSRIVDAQQMKKTVNFVLEEAVGDEDVVLKLKLNNPENRPITSVQAWLTYNPDVLKGVSIGAEDSEFELQAPYDNDFDHEAGLVMIGRSSAVPVLDGEPLVAEVRFERVGEGAAMIEAYDYRQDLTGHASANIMFDGQPLNLLLKPESPLLIINQ